MLLSETDDRFSIKKSAIPGAGRGLFARTPLAKGARLEIAGVLVHPGSSSDRSTGYADAYKFRVGRFLLIPMGFAGMVNHSLTPNMEKIVRGNRAHLRVLRRIGKGEELLLTYSMYAQKRFGLRRAS